MKKMNQKGALDLMLVAAIAIVLAVGGFVLWRVTSSSKSDDTKTSQEDTKGVEEQNENTVENEYFSMVLPEDWEEKEVASDDAPAGAPEAYFEFVDGKGRSIGVSINSLGFGGGGDGSAGFAVTDSGLKLDDKYETCDTEGDLAGACRAGDDELYLIVSDADEMGGDNYLFWLIDENEESQEAYKNLAQIVETLKFK